MQRHARSVLGILSSAGAGLLCASSCQSTDPADEQSQSGAVTSPSFLEFESGPVRPIALSPDGTEVVFTEDHRGTRTLIIADLSPEGALSNARALVPSARFEQAYTPRFSPDGKWVAYSAWTAGGYRDIRVVGSERMRSSRNEQASASDVKVRSSFLRPRSR